MNKTEFINAVAEKSGLSKVDAKKAVEAFVACRLLYQIIVISFLPTPILWFLQNKPVPLQAK